MGCENPKEFFSALYGGPKLSDIDFNETDIEIACDKRYAHAFITLARTFIHQSS